ncbi:hypothetical protein V8F06_014562 [Rhypophila decipiens]
MSKSWPIDKCKNVEVPRDEISNGDVPPCLEAWRECASSGCHTCRLAQLGAEYLCCVEPDTEHWRTVYLYTRTGATPTSWPGIGVGRDIGGESGQDPKEYVSLVSGWLDTCLHSHPACPKNTAVPLPSRLLDVQIGQDDRAGGDSIRLVSTSGLTGSYTALSHCWGGPIDVRTTKHNIASHQAGVQFSNLPRNFQDAVTVTRAIGLRYLWIDVIQDDKTDWEVESGNMANVYHQAYFLIGANVNAC